MMRKGSSSHRTKGERYIIQGNMALKPDFEEEYRQIRRKRAHTVPCVSVGYVFFLSAALILAFMALVGYIQMQAETAATLNHISRLETQLQELKESNDDTYNQIMSRVNLEEIKKTAVEELGMRYPEEWQIIYYKGGVPDYVKQIREIPNE